MSEIWKKIPGYDSFYEVSSEGRIRSLGRVIIRRGFTTNCKTRILSPTINSTGYYHVKIGGKVRNVHRLVCLAFHNNPNGYLYANHKDSNRLNNCESNLEWCSSSHNNKHAYALGFRGRTNIIPKVKCKFCGLMIGKNMISRHIKAKHHE